MSNVINYLRANKMTPSYVNKLSNLYTFSGVGLAWKTTFTVKQKGMAFLKFHH